MAKKKDTLSIVILIGFILFFILGIRKSWTQQTEEKTLMNAFKITQGSFVDCGVGKTADFGHYSFVLNDKVYTSYFKVDKFCMRPNDVSCTELKKYKFPVAYHPNDPDLNTMLLSKRDYGKYKLGRMDSLKIVFEKYFDCK